MFFVNHTRSIKNLIKNLVNETLLSAYICYIYIVCIYIYYLYIYTHTHMYKVQVTENLLYLFP